MNKLSEDQIFKWLKKEVEIIKNNNHGIEDDKAFLILAFKILIEDSDSEAKKEVKRNKGNLSDKGIDCLYIDKNNKSVHVLQGKYHKNHVRHERRDAVTSFAFLARMLFNDSSESLDLFFSGLQYEIAKDLKEAIDLLISEDYTLKLYFVTTAKINEDNSDIKIIEKELLEQGKKVFIHIYDYDRIITEYKRYLEEIVHKLGKFEISLDSNNEFGSEGYIQVNDRNQDIQSWIVTCRANELVKIYRKVGDKLFAKNVRSWLGEKTKVNKEIKKTLHTKQLRFWYYNNGITMLCDKTELDKENNKLIIENPQIINGLQTTKALSDFLNTHECNAYVLLKIICVGNSNRDDKFIDEIIHANNFQNNIKSYDLKSNDVVQLYLKRIFSQMKINYVTKRGLNTVNNSIDYFHTIQMIELAQILTSIERDPAILKQGKEKLFERTNYDRIFSYEDIDHKKINNYLFGHFLMKEVKNEAKGKKKHSYIVWHVLNFIWKKLSPLLKVRYKNAIELIKLKSKEHIKFVKRVRRLIKYVFKSYLNFYKAKKHEEDFDDIALFFKNNGRHLDFEEFWESKRNQSIRSKFYRELEVI
ncbi:MAG: AIPR family protein [Candidatus Micrarchaeota archaeon]|nr:AIPR family protein [Candidatus Micrarchaeota archaeon]